MNPSGAKDAPGAAATQRRKQAVTEAAPGARRPRIPRAAAERLIEAETLKLLAKHPVDEVTNDVIAAATGLNHSYVSRYYGNRTNLLIRLTDVLADEIKAGVPDDAPVNLTMLIADPRFRLRNQLVLHLVAKGVPAQRLYERGLLSRDSIKARIMRLHRADERMANALATQVFYCLVGAAFIGHSVEHFAETAELNDLVALAFAQIANSDALRATLNW